MTSPLLRTKLPSTSSCTSFLLTRLRISCREQFEALHERFATSSVPTRALLLSTYAKFLNLYPEELGALVAPILGQQASNIDVEIQQRAFEYRRLHLLQNSELMVLS